jgi:hypothetical protein
MSEGSLFILYNIVTPQVKMSHLLLGCPSYTLAKFRPNYFEQSEVFSQSMFFTLGDLKYNDNN